MKRAIAVVAILTLLVGAIVFLLERPEQGVAPVVPDQSTCAHCRMHIGDLHYAAQLQTSDGRVHNFDDPGCLFAFLREGNVSTETTYFHHHDDDAWIRGMEVGFVRVDEPTPMGYGLGAVRSGEHPEAMTLEDARSLVRRRDSRRFGNEQPDHPNDRRMEHR